MTPTSSPPIPPKRILVVEDEVVAAHTLRTLLAVDGHTVEIAQDGPQALAMLEAGPYDLIITDFKLGKMDGLEMDGLELADAIKKLLPGEPIILVTAYAEKINNSMGKVSNIDLVLSKPFSVSDLQQAMKKIFPAL